mgnify:CR=1 FL=1
MGLSSVRYARNKGLAQGRRHAAGSGFYDNVALILRLSMVGAGHHLCRPCFPSAFIPVPPLPSGCSLLEISACRVQRYIPHPSLIAVIGHGETHAMRLRMRIDKGSQRF